MLSFFSGSRPDVADCIDAIKGIKNTKSYIGGTVSFKTCSVSYDTASDIDGEKLKDAANAAVVAILAACKSHQGTYKADGPESSVKKPVVKEDEEEIGH